MGGQMGSMFFLILLIVLMYVMMIRPQRKKEKQIQEMRNNLQVGDEIITIGGICGKIVKTKDETLVIQVGTDRTKFEITRWAVSKVVNASEKAPKKPAEKEEAPKKALPKRMKKAAPAEEVAEAPVEEVVAPAEAPVEEVAPEEEVK